MTLLYGLQLPNSESGFDIYLSRLRKELHRCNVQALQTPIIGEAAEARALEAACLATLAERTRLENLQHSLDERARQRIPESS